MNGKPVRLASSKLTPALPPQRYSSQAGIVRNSLKFLEPLGPTRSRARSWEGDAGERGKTRSLESPETGLPIYNPMAMRASMVEFGT